MLKKVLGFGGKKVSQEKKKDGNLDKYVPQVRGSPGEEKGEELKEDSDLTLEEEDLIYDTLGSGNLMPITAPKWGKGSSSHLFLPGDIRSTGGLLKGVDHPSLKAIDWDKFEHLLELIGKTATNPDSLSALQRIRGIVSNRFKFNTLRRKEMKNNHPASSTYPLIPRTPTLYRTSMFVLDNSTHGTLRSSNRSSVRPSSRIQDMFDGTFFPTSYRDISDANVLAWRSTSSDAGGQKPVRDKNYIMHFQKRNTSSTKQLEIIQEKLQMTTVSSYFDTEAMKEWGWHALDLVGVCDMPMGLTAVTIFSEPGRFHYTTFGVSLADIASYFSLIGLNYYDNPYHNEYHGIDVLVATRYLLERIEHFEGISPKVCFAALFAAACHDVCHPGVTNGLLVNSGDDLAITYNDRAVLENFHVAQSFRMLRDFPNFFKGWTVAEKQTFRSIVIDCILGTDMAEHVKHHQFIQDEFDPQSYEGRIAFLPCVIHTADISNPAKPRRPMLEMCNRVMQEFFEQGDREKEIDLPISPLCDREAICIPKTQKGFIQLFVIPWFNTMSLVVSPGALEIPLKYLGENLNYWKQELEDIELKRKENCPVEDVPSEVKTNSENAANV